MTLNLLCLEHCVVLSNTQEELVVMTIVDSNISSLSKMAHSPLSFPVELSVRPPSPSFLSYTARVIARWVWAPCLGHPHIRCCSLLLRSPMSFFVVGTFRGYTGLDKHLSKIHIFPEITDWDVIYK